MSNQLNIDFTRTHTRREDPETSRGAARTLVASGRMAETTGRVLAALREAKRSVTGREIAKYRDIDGAWKRLSDLEKEGLALRAGTRKCSVTGRNATAWVAV